MSDLSFEEFYCAVHGIPPFPWQARAAERLAQRQLFAVNVPTGLGKSALIDAAVWAAGRGAWRRIAFVVDRRIVVDAVHQRAVAIKQLLESTKEPQLRAFAERLGEMQVVRLRGGVFGDDDWVLYPERLTVLLTTVDQLGSRLLFRGYGVSPRRWPLHAGFLGNDLLAVVDEAHLSTPFLQTLDAVRQQGAQVSVVPMTATPVVGAPAEQIALGSDDLALATVRERLAASKQVTLIEAGVTEGEFVKAAVEQTKAMLEQPGVCNVAVVVNRVGSARRIFSRLSSDGVHCALLTGRVRPAQRDAQLGTLLPLVQAGRDRSPADAPLVVVATQTIEVGADFDFDALVSECAPLSSLRQRFGRLDRLGQRGRSCGAILLRTMKDRDDPVYGTGVADARDWLLARAQAVGGPIDFGLEAMSKALATTPVPVEGLHHAASLLPTHVQMLAQTGPYAPELDLGAFLHGPTDRAPDVSIVWRDDLPVDDAEGWPRAVQLLPPMLREALPVPVAAARRWLAGGKVSDQWGDDGQSPPDQESDAPSARPVLRWRGPDDCRVVAAADIRPGDTIVVPNCYGGCDEWGWAPDSTVPVVDLADDCLGERVDAGVARRITLRLTEGHWHACGEHAPVIQARVAELLEMEARATLGEEDLEQDLERARQKLVDAVIGSAHPLAQQLHAPRLEHHPTGLVLRGSGIDELEGQIETGRAVSLQEHHQDVARWAQRLAGADPQSADIVRAAAVHDAGKAEPRMQALLHGNALAAHRGPVLAKSALRRRDQQLAAWLASGMPRGFRHEFATLVFEPTGDALTRHLIGTHHGYGRPWLVNCVDPTAPGASSANLDAHWGLQWADLLQQHGAWAMARMEWLLRAADARASIEEAAGDGEEVRDGA